MLVLTLLLGVATSSKTCLNDWTRDAADTCELYAELSECKAKSAMCSPMDVVYIQDMDGNLHSKMLSEHTFAALNVAALEVAGVDAVTLTFTHSYAGKIISFSVESDDHLKMAMSTKGSNGVFVADYVRDDGWLLVGTLGDWDPVVAKYPAAEWRYATKYNTGGSGVVHEVTPSSWNRGIRLMSENYMTMDNVKEFEMGVTVFYKGTDDAADWWQRYYQLVEGTYVGKWTNGASSTVELYVHKMANPWVHVGKLSDFDSVIASHPLTLYRYGVQYNSISGFVHNVSISGWNRGVRLTTEPYMMGEDGSSFDYGVTTFSRGTDAQTHTWEQYYYRLRGGSYDAFASNGDGSATNLFVQKI